MKRKGLGLWLHEYTDVHVEGWRRLFPVLDDIKMWTIRWDNNDGLVFDKKGLAYILGHITNWLQPMLNVWLVCEVFL